MNTHFYFSIFIEYFLFNITIDTSVYLCYSLNAEKDKMVFVSIYVTTK